MLVRTNVDDMGSASLAKPSSIYKVKNKRRFVSDM